jgi:hypothetical protein
MAKSDNDKTKAVAHLPNLDVEILHRRPWHGEEELLSITLRAVPSFVTFFHFVQAPNPMLLWMRTLETAWSPWLRLDEARRPPLIGGDV